MSVAPPVETDANRASEPGARGGKWPLVALVGLGLVSEGAYALGLVRSYWLPRYVAQPLLDLGKIGGYDPGAGLRYALPLLVAWLAYLLAGALAPQVRRGLLPLALAGGGLFGLTLLWLYPITAADIFNYLLYGIAQHRGANPLVTPPVEVIAEPLIGYSAWPSHPSPYGPAWQLLAYGLTALTGERLLAGIAGFKLLLLAAHLANTLLVARIAAALGQARPDIAALLYAWNPLLLYESAGNGHNDVVMLTTLLLALWAVTRRGRWRAAALPFATLGIAVKYISVLWLPALALHCWWLAGRDGARRRLVGIVLGCAVLFVALYAPYWAGGRALTGLQRQADLYTTSFGGLAMIVLVERGHYLASGTLLLALKGLAAAALAATLAARLRHTRAGGGLVETLFDLTLVYLLLGALWFQPWYVTPLAGLAVLAGPARRALAVAFALGATTSYLVYFFLWPALGWGTSRLVVQTLAVGVTYGPVLAVLAALTLPLIGQRLRRHTAAGPTPARASFSR